MRTQGENYNNIREKFSVTFWERKHLLNSTILKKEMKKAECDRFRDILIQWMHTPTHTGRFAITFKNGKGEKPQKNAS